MPVFSEKAVIQSDVSLRRASSERPTVVSWSSAPPEVKRGLPPPPERKDFHTTDEFEEARSGWAHRVAPVLSIRQAAWNRALSSGR